MRKLFFCNSAVKKRLQKVVNGYKITKVAYNNAKVVLLTVYIYTLRSDCVSTGSGDMRLCACKKRVYVTVSVLTASVFQIASAQTVEFCSVNKNNGDVSACWNSMSPCQSWVRGNSNYMCSVVQKSDSGTQREVEFCAVNKNNGDVFVCWNNSSQCASWVRGSSNYECSTYQKR